MGLFPIRRPNSNNMPIANQSGSIFISDCDRALMMVVYGSDAGKNGPFIRSEFKTYFQTVNKNLYLQATKIALKTLSNEI